MRRVLQSVGWLMALLWGLPACSGRPAPAAAPCTPARLAEAETVDTTRLARRSLELAGLQSTEGNAVDAYLDARGHLRVVQVNIYGETGRAETTHYIRGAGDFTARQVLTYYEGIFGPERAREESTYRFCDGRPLPPEDPEVAAELLRTLAEVRQALLTAGQPADSAARAAGA